MNKERLKSDLARMGLKEGDLVMTHESLKSIGWIDEGPEGLIEAFLDVIGPHGTLMKYIGAEEGAPFDPHTSPAVREWGLLGEVLRRWPGAQRSFHPDSSFVAVGHLARWITESHPFSYGYGPDSPLGRLVEARGKVILIGCPLEHLTLLHHSEHMAALPHKKKVNFQCEIIKNGEIERIEIEEFDTSSGIVNWPGPDDYFALIVKEYFAAGFGTKGLVGNAQAYLLDAPLMHSFAKIWMEKHLEPIARQGGRS